MLWCCTDTCTVFRRIHVLVRNETCELNSWQRQESCPSPDNWLPAFPERGSISRLSPSRSRCISISILSLYLSSSLHFLLVLLRSSLFPPIPPSSPMNAFGSQERSFSSFRNATLRLPLFSRRISLIFCFLFQVLRTTVQSGLQADFVNLREANQLKY